jgi:hypothetical protein
MANNAGDVASVSAHMDAGTTLHVVTAAGFTDGVNDASTVDLATVDADLAAANIKTGTAILGVTGTYDTEAGAPIEAGTVLVDKVGFVNGSKITGTMVSHVADIEASAISNDGTKLEFTVPAGYYPGTIKVYYTDTDFVAANIGAGVTIFGVAGSHA